MFWIFILLLIALCGTAAVVKGIFWYVAFLVLFWTIFHFIPWLFSEGLDNLFGGISKFFSKLKANGYW